MWHLLLDRERLLTLQSTQCIESPSSGQEVDAAYFLFLQSMQRADMIPDSFLPFDGVYVRTILEHLQKFVIFYLANLVICQLQKLFAK